MPLAHVRGPGHPDALCDAMAIALVEEYLRRDPDARMRLSVTGGRESIFVDGDLITAADFDAAPILRRALAQVDPTLSAEPFLTCEPVEANFLPRCASFEPWMVYGYATGETSDGWPPAQSAARSFARAVEVFRVTHSEGYLLGSDYEIIADDGAQELSMRFEHSTSTKRQGLEKLLEELLVRILPGWHWQVLSSGASSEAGLRRRSGMSGQSSAYDVYSSHIPAPASGVGYGVRHPGNLGVWLARAAAHNLVTAGFGRGVLLVLRWNPFETRPLIVSARNDKGDDLRHHLHPEQFDLSAAHEKYTEEGMLGRMFRDVWKKA